MNTKVILLVEDDYLNRRLIKKLLLPLGYELLEAKNKQEALLLVSQKKIDLAIFDIDLGVNEEDGISLATYLLKSHTIPIIYLTVHDTRTIVQRAIATNPAAYLTKPIRTTDLLAAVELALQKSALTLQKQEQIITLKEDEYFIKVPIDQIEYIVSDRNYLLFHCKTSVYKHRCTIKQMIEFLPSDKFIQTHRA